MVFFESKVVGLKIGDGPIFDFSSKNEIHLMVIEIN